MKAKWTNKIPNAEGWYWCRYSSKHGGLGTAPCLVVHFKTMGSIICIARVGDFPIHANTRKADMDKLRWLKLKFGPPIPMPR
jgi:hypothetical protein